MLNSIEKTSDILGSELWEQNFNSRMHACNLPSLCPSTPAVSPRPPGVDYGVSHHHTVFVSLPPTRLHVHAVHCKCVGGKETKIVWQ